MRAPNALIFFYPQTKSFIYPYCNCICMEMFPRWLSRSLNLAATHAPGSYWSPNWGLSKIPASLSRLIFVSLFCSIFVFRCVEGWRRVRKMRTMHPPVANDNLNVGGWTHWDSQPKHNTCISCVSFSGRDNHNPSAHLHSLWTFYESKMCLSAALLFVWMMNSIPTPPHFPSWNCRWHADKSCCHNRLKVQNNATKIFIFKYLKLHHQICKSCHFYSNAVTRINYGIISFCTRINVKCII